MDYIVKELPITLDIEFTVDFGHALPLCILASREQFKNWLLQNYMMPVIFYTGINQFDCLVIDAMRYGFLSKVPPSLMRFSFVGDDIMSNVRDIICLVKKRIAEGWYCILFLDCYYIHGTDDYQKNHYAHEVLLYGYNDTEQTIRAVIFDNALKPISVPYCDIGLSYREAFRYIKDRPGWDEYMMLLYKPTDEHREEYPYDVHSVLDKLKYYLDAKMAESDYYSEYLYLKCGKEKCYPGILMNKAVLEMARELKGRFVELGTSPEKYELFWQYHPLHTYSEFHKGLFRRIQYLYSHGGEFELNRYQVDKYSEIVLLCERIRLCYIKINVMKKGKNEKGIIDALENIIKYAEEIYEKEPDILWNIIHC